MNEKPPFNTGSKQTAMDYFTDWLKNRFRKSENVSHKYVIPDEELEPTQKPTPIPRETSEKQSKEKLANAPRTYYRGMISRGVQSLPTKSLVDLEQLYHNQDRTRKLEYADKLLWLSSAENGGRRLVFARFLMDVCLYPDLYTAAQNGAYIPTVIKYDVPQTLPSGKLNVYYAGDDALQEYVGSEDQRKQEFIAQEATPLAYWQLNQAGVNELLDVVENLVYPRFDDYLDKVWSVMWVRQRAIERGIPFESTKAVYTPQNGEYPPPFSSLLKAKRLEAMTFREAVLFLKQKYLEEFKMPEAGMQEFFASRFYGTFMVDDLLEKLETAFEQVSIKSG